MASQVPYNGQLEASPQLDPLQNAHLDVTPNAFGANVGQAVQHVGEVAEGAGKELFARAYGFQELDQQVKADSAAADFSDKTVQRYMDLDKLKGPERVAALQKYTQDLSQDRQDAAGQLQSPYAKARFLDESRRTQSQMLWHGAILTRQAFDESNEAAVTGKMNSTAQRISSIDSTGMKDFDDAAASFKKDASHLVATTGRLGGFAPGTPENDRAAAPIVSKNVSQIIAAKSNSDPILAKQLLEHSKESNLLTPEDYDKLSERVQNAVNIKQAREIGHTIGGDPDNKHKSPAEIEQMARAKAAELDPNNKDLADNAGDFATERQNHEKQVEIASWRETQQTLMRGVDGSTTNGKVPLSFDEAAQDPVWRDKFNSLPADGPERGAILEQIKRNNTTDGWIQNEDGNREFALLHTRLTDPNSSATDVDDALNIDLYKSRMTREQRSTIMDLQSKILNAQSNQGAINSAISLPAVQLAMKNAGISKADTPEQYNEFFTKFTEAVKSYAEGGHHTVKDNEQLGKIANDMLMTQHNLIFPNGPPVYQNPFNDTPLGRTLKANAIRMYKEKYGIAPNPDQLQSMGAIMYQKYFTDLGQKSRPGTSTDKSANRVEAPK